MELQPRLIRLPWLVWGLSTWALGFRHGLKAGKEDASGDFPSGRQESRPS